MTRLRAYLSTFFVAALVLLVSVPCAAVEYQINFHDGTTLRTARVRQVGEAIQYEKFGGEASVAVEEVASVFVIEVDGTISWVMHPYREGKLPPSQPSPAKQPAAETAEIARPTSPEPAPTQPEDVGSDLSSPADDSPAAAGQPALVSSEDGAKGPLGEVRPPSSEGRSPVDGDRQPAVATADGGVSSLHSSNDRESRKIILEPAEPLYKVVLRWGAAPGSAFVLLGGVALFFRSKYRKGKQGIQLVDSLDAGREGDFDFSVPAKSWETLSAAVEERNFDVYRLCWAHAYSDEELDLAFQKNLENWKYYDYTVIETEPSPADKERHYLHVRRSTKFDREDLEEREKRLSLLLVESAWKFEELPYGF